MIEIDSYRCRIGSFCHYSRNRNRKFEKFYRQEFYEDRNKGKSTLSCLQFLTKLILILAFLPNLCSAHPVSPSLRPTLPDPALSNGTLPVTACPQVQSFQQFRISSDFSPAQWHLQFHQISKKMTVNHQAKSTNGNKEQKRGIKNMHLNIRSLGSKVIEVKNIIWEQKPHILGLSECELKKVNGNYDVDKLKIPGYDLLFPKSWTEAGFARVVIYVKKTLHYQQVHDLEDSLVQTVWLKGGFKGSKPIYFCHGYREHTSTLGSSIRDQKLQLEKFLLQWEEAALHNSSNEPNEVHISCDMNLDSLNERWLRPDYHLVTLARMVQTSCHLGNFCQLVTVPTRFQYNSVKDETAISCIDHIYTNSKFRCSNVTVVPFGGSDHDGISYIRFSKIPPSPARTVRKRSYKNFDQSAFLSGLGKVDWTEVYSCEDVDLAAEILTRKFVDVLNIHAPWVIFQQRKLYKPWITEETKGLIKTRDNFKKQSEDLASAGDIIGARTAWSEFKKLRNKINNKKKYEEKNFKSQKVEQSLDSPANIWSTAKSFMDWEDSGGPPTQLKVDNKIITKAGCIATIMYKLFIQKVTKIIESIQFRPNLFQ